MTFNDSHIKTARKRFFNGLLEKSISSYNSALSNLADHIRSTTNHSMRNKYVEVI